MSLRDLALALVERLHGKLKLPALFTGTVTITLHFHRGAVGNATAGWEERIDLND